VIDETNGSQVEQVDLDELDDEEAPCVTLRNMSIGDVCPKESEEPTQAQDQPSSSMQGSPPTQDKDCWGEGEEATLRSSLRHSRCTNGGKTTGGVYPSPCTLQDEGLRRRHPVPRHHPTWRPTWDSAHCNRPRTEKCVTSPICNSFSVMIVYNPPLWEYSGDSPGA
jgi:hypothetical protein